MASPASRRIATGVVALVLLATGAASQDRVGPTAALDSAMAEAEANLRAGERQIAESRYRTALFHGWMIAGALHLTERQLTEARDAFARASGSAAEAVDAFRSLALVQMQLKEAGEAVSLLARLSLRDPSDHGLRRLLAQAQVANGQPEEAIQTLEEALTRTPDDAEVAFLLASVYLQVKNVAAAEKLFQQVAAARPGPQTWVLIGRTYRDFRMYDRARAALTTALKLDPRTRRAHYYLGTVVGMAEGVVGLDQAITEFRKELQLAPDDLATKLPLGMALVETRRYEEALPVLQAAAKNESATAFLYLGRCQLALDQAGPAMVSLRRALDLAPGGGDGLMVKNIHYQLGLALRRSGAAADAEEHFAAAKAASARRADTDREQLEQYLQDASETDRAAATVVPLDSPFGTLPPEARAALSRRVRETLARAYFNLGVMRAQAQQFATAADFFASAAEVEPDFPQVQYSLGVARFNAGHFEQAAAPLERARHEDPNNVDVKRMLALAYFNAGAYRRAAELLESDPRRPADASLEYAYGVALARSDRAPEAEAVFARLLAQHGDRAEVHVILGQAHAQQGDFDAAVASLERARSLKADVADANATLGYIFMRQGKLAEAEAALRDELKSNARHVLARHTLAVVLDLAGKPDEALDLLRGVLADAPSFADARYLSGKILLATGKAEEAAQHLEIAVRHSPDDATYHYQLSLAYMKTGRRELADKHLAIYRELKDKRAGRTP